MLSVGRRKFVRNYLPYDSTKSILCSVVLLIGLALPARGKVLYVNAAGVNPTPPYTNWSTAATRIQDAIASTTQGDTVLVTNGVYATGGAVVFGSQTNRVALSNGVALLSVNGPDLTAISGGTQIRGVYVGSNCFLSGFSITNGHTRASGDNLKEQSGGGVWCETGGVVSNCVIAGNIANRNGGGVYGGTLFNCVLVSNLATFNGGGAYRSAVLTSILSTNSVGYFGHGGGACQSLLTNCMVQGNTAIYSGVGFGAGTSQNINFGCTIVGNIAGSGGGTEQGTNYNCTISGNRAIATGGGALMGVGYNCLFSQNSSSQFGGGLYNGTYYNCVSSNNVVTNGSGGGACNATVFNSLIVSNQAAIAGGGSYQCVLYNCTITGNSATNSGGGDSGSSTVENSILYYNSAPSGSNWSGSSLNLCCTTPAMGVATLTNPPLFVNLPAGNLHLQSNSICINSGRISVALTNAGSTDLEGNQRIVAGLVDLGAYEVQNPASTLPYSWLYKYNLALNGSDDFSDTDGDKMNNWREWRTGTDPKNAASLLRMLSISNSLAGVTVNWQGSPVFYFLERSTDLSSQPAFTTIKTSITGVNGVNTYTDASATNLGPYFYRVGAQ